MPVLACFSTQIEDRHAGRFAAGAGGGRNGDQRLERPGHRLAPADRRVDVVEEVGRIRRVQIGRLGRVDRAAAADGDERVELSLAARRRSPSRKLASVGSTRTRSKTSKSTRATFIAATTVSPTGKRQSAGSITTSVRRTSSTRSIPTSRVTPRAETDVRRGHLKRGVVRLHGRRSAFEARPPTRRWPSCSVVVVVGLSRETFALRRKAVSGRTGPFAVPVAGRFPRRLDRTTGL